MATFNSNRREAEEALRREVFRRLARVGFAGERAQKVATPVRSGTARRSVHVVVVDERGRRVDGDATDDNGSATPQYPATGRPTTYLGTNCGYYRHMKGGGTWTGLRAAGLGFDAMREQLGREFGGGSS